MDLDRQPDLAPVGLVHDLALLPPLLTLPGYQRLGLHLRDTFDQVHIDTYDPSRPVDPRTDVLLFPYDFRRSVAETSVRLADAVEAALRARGQWPAPDRPVIVVAHSLGGLVARHWIATREGWRLCTALMTLGTPHRGAPKALDWLVNGAGAGSLRDPRMTRMIRRWPSMYELLPQYQAVWDAAAEAPVALTRLPESLLGGYAPEFARLAAEARHVHEAIRAGWAALAPDQAPVTIPYLARGHATLNLATLQAGQLRISKSDPPWLGNVGSRGDGTVPFLSAIPPELGERVDAWRAVPDRHGPIGSIRDPIEMLRRYSGDRAPIPGRGQPDRPWLGLDLDDFAMAGQPVPVGVTLLPAPMAGARAQVTVTLLGATVVVHQDRLVAAGPDQTGAHTWRGELPPLPVGAYEVAVEVVSLPALEPVAHADTLAVIDAAREGLA